MLNNDNGGIWVQIHKTYAHTYVCIYAPSMQVWDLKGLHH